MTVYYPLIELTDWVFEGERIFEAVTEEDKGELHSIRLSQLGKHLRRELVDGSGQIIRPSDPVVVNRKKSPFPTLWEHRAEVRFDFNPTGKTISLDQLKERVLNKSDLLFHINKNKFLSREEFHRKIDNSKTHGEVISIATFRDFV